MAEKTERKTVKIINKTSSPFGGAYLVTYVGAAVYFFHQTSGFWGMVWALVKALFWPGYIVYHILQLMHV
jgi:hypothetical protein